MSTTSTGTTPWGSVDHQQPLTPREAADFLKISENTLRRLSGPTGIPFSRIGAQKRYTLVDLVAYINRRKIDQPGAGGGA